MMRRGPIPVLLALILAVAAGGIAHGQPQPAGPPDPWATSFRPLPFHELAERVSSRYAGRLIAAETRPPRPPERDLGVELVYEFRLLTPARNILDIRMDARTGRFLDVSGRGQVQARRPLSAP